MKEYNLTAQELIYLCALSGAKFVAGVEDVFMSVPKEKLVGLMSEIKDSLIEKECLIMDFDGNYGPAEDIAVLTDTIIQSDRRVAFYVTDGKKEKYGMIYIKGDTVYLSERSEDVYHIRPTAVKDILPFFAVYIKDGIKGSVAQNSVSIGADILETAKEQFENKKITNSKKTLTDAGLDSKIKDLLLASYAGKAAYLAVKADNLIPDKVFSDGLIYISDGETTVDIDFNPEREDNVLNIKNTSSEKEKEKLTAMLAGFDLVVPETEERQ